MKSIIPYLSLFLVLGLSACTERTASSEKTTCQKAALELYCKYANNDNLTVAYLGDFNLKGKEIDAVMLQANDDDEWLLLCQNLGLVIESDSCEQAIDLTVCPDSEKVVSVGVGIEMDFLDVLGLDSLTTRDQITEEHIRLFSENVALQLRNILDNFGGSDSLLPATAIVMGDGPVKFDDENTSYDDYINAVALTVATNIIDEYFVQRDSVDKDDSGAYLKALEEGDNMMTSAKLHGHSGFITAADHVDRTLWFFFYDDQEECNNIITHINEDLIVK